MPDTLDLADRARSALHGIANTVDPQDEYQMWFEVYWNNNLPYMKHSGCDVECTPKFFDALTQLRLACGTNDFQDIEQGMEKALLSYLDPRDGMYYRFTDLAADARMHAGRLDPGWPNIVVGG